MKSVTKCANCKKRLSQPKRGRRRKYCSASCRQRAYEKRRLEREIEARLPSHLLDSDIENLRSRTAIERAVVDVLHKLAMLPSPVTAQYRKPNLRVIDGKEDDDPPK